MSDKNMENEVVDVETGEIMDSDLSVIDDSAVTTDIVTELTQGVNYFTTFKNELVSDDKEIRESAIEKLMGALLGADKSIEDCVGETIYISEIVSYYERRKNGDILPIFILYGDDGTTYVTGSKGVYNSLKKIIPLIGSIDLRNKPYGIKVQKVKVEQGQCTIFKPVGFKK